MKYIILAFWVMLALFFFGIHFQYQELLLGIGAAIIAITQLS